MSTLYDARNADLSGYTERIEPLKPSLDTHASSLEPVYNTFLRCPLPPVAATSDTLRQFYIRGQIPQFRILTAGNNNQNAVGGGTVINNINVTSSGGGGGTPILPPPPPPPPDPNTLKQVSLTTPTINPSGRFITTIGTSRTYQLISITTSSSARVELYSTASSQSGDLSRGLDIAPPAGTYQGIICDLALDADPFSWYFESLVGNNADHPQQAVTYITVTNIGNTSAAITVSFAYLVLEA